MKNINYDNFSLATSLCNLYFNEKYNLNTNNCTSVCFNILEQIGINCKKTIGSWYKGSGMNPADCREDLREMILNSNEERYFIGRAPENTPAQCLEKLPFVCY